MRRNLLVLFLVAVFPLWLSWGVRSAQAVDFDAGNLQGTVSWNGAPLSGLAAQDPDVAISSGVNTFLSAGGTYSLLNLPVGAYTANVYESSCFGDANKLGQSAPVTVSAGSTSTADFDITTTAGLVTGTITVNGAPLPHPNVGVPSSCNTFGNDAQGHFAHFLPPGSYTATVSGPSGLLGTFSFTVLAGQTTDVDLGTTPTGSNVTLPLSGGLGTVGGLQVTFSTVTSGGNTTAVESGSGPPPPTGYEIVGLSGLPRYWDITSSAGYAGSITVCIKYDETQVSGPESQLQLVHDAGSGFANITASVDTINNIICGTTTSLSPFAVAGHTDTDHDHCTDLQEEQTAMGSQTSGGRRDPTTPWDYFNPTHDGMNRSDDMLAVQQHYGLHQGSPGYSTDYDRTYIGPNVWNLGPPNGNVTAVDMLAMQGQYHHDCA